MIGFYWAEEGDEKVDPGPRLYDFVLHTTAVRCDMTNVWSRYKMNGNISMKYQNILHTCTVPVRIIQYLYHCMTMFSMKIKRNETGVDSKLNN